jgi:16S rRNA (adenine1518-N6/adenine1519-N6)-dimethyltransferase
VQREVAERLRAAPGSRTYGGISVLVQARFAVRIAEIVSPGAFVPAPKIDSAVMLLEPLDPPRAPLDDALRTVVRAAFGVRRKMLRNAWRGLAGWSPEELAAHAAAAGIRLDARAETLDVEAFARLAARLPGAR